MHVGSQARAQRAARAALGPLIISSIFVCGSIASAQPTAATDPAIAPDAAEHVLRVGCSGSAPFVLSGDEPAGLSVDVFRAVATRAQLPYRLIAVPSVAEALRRVERGELDVAIGPISITSERAERVRFTQPYFNSQLGILARAGSAGVWSRLVPFMARAFAGTSLALIAILVGVGALIWALERRRNPEQFPAKPTRGIANGLWFALVTMTTVGYGDRVPVTAAGRAVAGAWMLIALVTTTSLTAGLASAFTVLQLDTASISDAAELQGKRVAVVRGTTGADFAVEHGAKLVPQRDFFAAMKAVERGDALAAVHDKPMLAYYLAQTPGSALRLASAEYDPQRYGFAVNPNSDVVRRLNIALLSSQEAGELHRITRGWLGK